MDVAACKERLSGGISSSLQPRLGVFRLSESVMKLVHHATFNGATPTDLGTLGGTESFAFFHYSKKIKRLLALE